jgi:hypothetical protein
MQPQKTALVYAEQVIQFFALTCVLHFRERLDAQHLRIGLDKLDAVSPVHLERLAKLLHHGLVVGPLHAPVDLVQHNHVGRMQHIDLLAEFLSGRFLFVGIAFGRTAGFR